MEFASNWLLNHDSLTRKMFNYLVIIGVSCNILVLIAAHIDNDLILASICYSLMFFTLFGFFVTKTTKGAHFQLISYIIGFTYASTTHLVSYPLVLVYPVVIGFAVLFFRSIRIKMCYLFICLMGCTITLINLAKFLNLENDSNYFWSNVIICYGQIFALFLLHQLYSRVLHKYRTTLHKKNQQLQKILDVSPSGIAYRDLETKRVTSCNDRFLQIFGAKSLKELDGLHPSSLMPEFRDVDHAEFHEKWLDDYSKGGMMQRDLDWENLEGKKMKVRVKSTLDDSYDDHLSSITFLDDVTEEVRAKQQLQEKNKELERYIESNIQLEKFAHIASHDLMAPANTVKTFSKLIKNRIYDGLKEQERNFVDIIHDNSVEMHKLIQDLLEYSKVNSQKVNLSRFDCHQLVKEVITILQLSMEEKGISFSLKNKLPTIIADRVKMKRVFQNLLSNAIKFSKPKPDSEVWIDFEDQNDYWVFLVGDNGIGMPETDIDIFEPYTQLNLKDEYKGTGMGLSFCKKIIEQHNGSINFVSKYREGTVFAFTISKRMEKSPVNEKVQKDSTC